MIITLKNFGPIRELSLDLSKDLHLLYGKNGVGKSYAGYAVYILLKNIQKRLQTYANEGQDRRPLFTNAKELEQKILSSEASVSTWDITGKVNQMIQEEFDAYILPEIKNSFLNTFSNLNALSNRKSKEVFSITLVGKLGISYTVSLENGVLTSTHSNPISYSICKNDQNEYRLFMELETIKQEMSFNDNSTSLDNLAPLSAVLSISSLVICYGGIGDVFYLPSSRSGLYEGLNAFSPIMAQLTQSRFLLQNTKIELPTLTEPVSDYYIDLSTLDAQKANPSFERIIQKIEKEIIQGEVRYDKENKKISVYHKEIDIELHAAQSSSMVAELAPLVLFLKHIIHNKYGYIGDKIAFISQENNSPFIFPNTKPQHILFIEEPETHLHPELQVKLMEVFAELSQLNIKVFLTSHSNYMFNKLNNQVLKKEVGYEKVAVYHLIDSPEGAIQNPEMTMTEEGAFDENFQSITEELFDERMNALDELDDADR